jgi:hypothetical protein
MPNVNKLANEVGDAMRSLFVEHGWCNFSPSIFVNEGLGTVSEILQAFAILREREQIEIFVTIQCPHGHSVWRGPAVGVRAFLRDGFECAECGDFYEETDGFQMFAKGELTPAIKEIWGAKKNTPYPRQKMAG